MGRTNPLNAFRHVMRSLLKTIAGDEEWKDAIARSGAAVETTLLQTIGEYSENATIAGREFTGLLKPLEFINNPSKFLKGIGFIGIEKFQRNFAASMGRSYAEDLISKYSKIVSGKMDKGKAAKYLKQMEELGIKYKDEAGQMLDPNMIDENSMLRASLKFSNTVNFRTTADVLPLANASPYAKIFTKFKSFAFNHMLFLNDNVIKPATGRGSEATGKFNIMPLAYYLSAGAGIGMGVDKVRRMIRGDDSDYEGLTQWARGMTAVGGAGILYDILMSAQYGKAGALTAVAGPALRGVGRISYGGSQSLKRLYQEIIGESQGRDAFDIGRPLLKQLSKTQVYPMQKQIESEILAEIQHKKMVRSLRFQLQGGGGPRSIYDR